MTAYIDYLISAQHEMGGWGYLSGRKPVIEPTSAVLLALRDEPGARDSFQRGITWLLKCQHQDGGWGINENDLESGWQTAWALIALKYSNQGSDSVSRGEHWLQSVATLEFTADQFLNPESLLNGQLLSLVWPWLPGQGGWIEPTALAVLALANLADSPSVAPRLQAALSYFKKNRTPEGGWNIGNATPLDTTVLPRAFPTALVLIAMERIARQDIQSIDLTALQQDVKRDPSILVKSAGLLAIRSLGQLDETLNTYLTAHQLQDGSWDHNPFSSAWAGMALRGYL